MMKFLEGVGDWVTNFVLVGLAVWVWIGIWAGDEYGRDMQMTWYFIPVVILLIWVVSGVYFKYLKVKQRREDEIPAVYRVDDIDGVQDVR